MFVAQNVGWGLVGMPRRGRTSVSPAIGRIMGNAWGIGLGLSSPSAYINARSVLTHRGDWRR